MGEGNYGILFGLVLYSPYIAVGLAFVVGMFVLLRAKTRSGRGIGLGIIALTLVGIIVPPLFNAQRLDGETDKYLALSKLPEALDLRGAKIILLSTGAGGCDALCEMLRQRDEIAEIWFPYGPNNEDAAELYRPSPFDLTDYRGEQRIYGADGMYTRQEGMLPADATHIFLVANKWLSYHDPDAVLAMPSEAYQGQFIYRIEDAMAFDIATAEQLAAVYQSGQTAPRYLWFSQAKTDSYQPTTAQYVDILEAALVD